MEQHLDKPLDHDISLEQSADQTRAFVARVFSWMVAGLTITGLTAYAFGTTDLVQYLIKADGTGVSPMFWVVAIAPFGFILAMNFGFNRMSQGLLTMLFLAFSFVMGISLFYIFLIYSGSSIATVFFITAATFGVMAFLGYTTKTDLTKMGSILYMGLIGIVIAMVVNFFMKSEFMDYIISVIGVLIFTGLTAYDVQKIKRIGAGVEYGSATAGKLAIMGATSLYLDFINLFLFLLRILGSRD